MLPESASLNKFIDSFGVVDGGHELKCLSEKG